MGKFRIRKFISRVTEIILVVLLVLVFFAMFTTLLFRFFPSGISLTEILERKEAGVGHEVERKLLGLDDGGGSEPVAASLSQAYNEVKSKVAGAIVWGKARTGMSLYDRDAIQTLEKSTAQIRFDSRNYVNLGSNTLVIIKKIEKNRAGKDRRSVMLITDGELSGRLDTAKLEITSPNAFTRLNTNYMQGLTTEFRLSINPDQSSSIVIYQGEAEVSAQGKTIKIRENRGVTVKPGEAPHVVDLLFPPVQLLPGDGNVIPYREQPPQVRFSWEATAGATNFHLQLASDKSFKNLLFDRRIGENRFMHGNLKKGVYFWRVSSIRDGLEGRPGKIMRLEVKQSLSPPPLKISFPSEIVMGGSYVLHGTTARGSTVFVDGKQVKADAEGAFSCEVVIKPGMNLVTVEAFDTLGNATYRSQYVQGGAD